MKSNPYKYSDWQHLIPNIESAINEMSKTPILSVGITPYTRIIPAFFLDNYSIYSAKRSSDVDVIEQYTKMHVLEDMDPAIAKRVHGTSFLVKSPAFKSFLRSIDPSTRLMFYTMTDDLVRTLRELNLPFIGNDPKICEEVKYKSSFRELLKRLEISSPKSKSYFREDFFNSSFDALRQEFSGSFVIQRGDKETGGNEGTFFVHKREDFEHALFAFKQKPDFEQVVVTQFIDGYSTSMLGCAMDQGTISGPLQLQLVDVPESLQSIPNNGIFFGNDLEFKMWNEETEIKAQDIVEKIGAHLYQGGYRGIFGIDFLFDKNRQDIFAIECNPRFTGSLLLHSLSMLELKNPPLEFFHLASHLGIHLEFDFEKVNTALKKRAGYSHISFSPKEIPRMLLPLVAGVYSFNEKEESLVYKGTGISLSDLKSKDDFLLIDTVPQPNYNIEVNVPRLFKLIFPYSIAIASNKIEKRSAFLVNRFASSLIEALKHERNN
ncbi:MAG: ATP-grasp domain-containing protein [Patescibacteria group bacterium]